MYGLTLSLYGSNDMGCWEPRRSTPNPQGTSETSTRGIKQMVKHDIFIKDTYGTVDFRTHRDGSPVFRPVEIEKIINTVDRVTETNEVTPARLPRYRLLRVYVSSFGTTSA